MDKVCRKCLIEKDINQYHKDKTKKDGYKHSCKSCQKLYSDIFYIKNKDRILESSKIYHKEYYNREDVKQHKVEYTKAWAENNQEWIKKYRQNYHNINKENFKNYKFKNKDSINNTRRDSFAKNPLLKIKSSIRNSVYFSIKRSGFSKKSRTQEILGCSFEEFKQYLESKFELWMTWENYGKCNGELNYGWDIDHIIPVSSAETEGRILELNHYSNLQPLDSKINRYMKRDSIEWIANY